MPKYEVTAPDGARYEVDAPDEAALNSAVEQAFGAAQPAQSAPSSFEGLGGAAKAFAGGVSQGASFGGIDEAFAAAQSGGDKAKFDQLMQQYQGQINAAKQQQGPAYMAGEVVGAIGGALTGSGLVAKMMPKTVQTIMQGLNATRATQLAGAAGTGAVSGGLYGFGTGQGDIGQRAEAAVMPAVAGGIAGPLASMVAPKVVSLADRAKGLFTRKAEKAASIAPVATTSTGTAVESVRPASVIAQTGKAIDLPRGAATKDIDLMRYEESARQGVLGPELQSSMRAIDENVGRQAQDIAETMTGAKPSEDLLTSGIETFRTRFEKQKSVANKLMDARNNALAKSSVYKGYTRDTLGNEIKTLASTPNFKTIMPTPAGKVVKERLNYLNNLIKSAPNGKFEKPLDFVELAAWRKSLNDIKPEAPEYQYTKQFSKIYDNWLENIGDTAFAQGDTGLVDKISKANRFYRDFKEKFSTNTYKGQGRAVENLLTKEDYTPAQAVNMIFGKNTEGNNFTAQSVGRILKALPEAKKAQASADFRAGLIARAKENATTGDKFSLPIFRNNLLKMQKSEAYRLHLKDDVTDKALTALVKDLGDYIESTGRRDVISPSGGAVARTLQGIINASGTLLGPVGGRVVSEIGVKGIQNASKAKSRIEVEKTINQYFQDAIKQTNEKAFSLPASIAGGVYGASVEQPNQEAQ